MKIVSIETVTVNVPFRRRHRSHGRVGRGVTRTIVKVGTDAGVTGLGESLHYQSKYVIDQVLGPAVLGLDPHDLARLRAFDPAIRSDQIAIVLHRLGPVIH